ncbi:hypothetical protein [Bacillus methanolicus]|uniref:Uncharacterized protein n=1 Tax=Bacillus methanolicus (strain MGA3 / ATCC 53907) TaxID=796606 RepID=I3DTE3_BACMM|nr:hypothetical protein [Bacillus methanolicus]AIE61761.1 hypothetical protein BMMGA3_17070 [Bacillus methanolicus MGA3]EIJ77514.1 hypothetical protein MGA3_17472 [Bacillus methanolicus MGA3]
MKKEKERRTRSDKKRDVKPTITIQLKECIYRLSYITNTPVKDVAETICEAGLVSRKVMDYLSQHFRRPVRLKNTLYMGDLDRSSLQKRSSAGQCERITIRLPQGTYENLTALAYALDVTPSRATALLLDASIRNSDFINEYVRDYLKQHLDDGRMRELKKVMKFINTNNPYEEEISWSALLSFLFDELKIGASNISESIQDWLDKWNRKER